MKKKLFLILICCVMSMSVFAEDYTDYTDANNVTWRVTLNQNTMEATILQGVRGNTKDVVVPGSITIDGQNYTVTALGYLVFEGRTDIETISLPTTITTIAGEYYYNGDYYGEFSHNKNLKSVDFNGAPCVISSYAFYGCYALTSVGDLSKCTSIGKYAFYGCYALTSVGDLSKCTSIGKYAFYDCSALTSVGDLSQCISIGESAFCRCFSLASVGDLSKCTSIGDEAFLSCYALTSVGDLSKCTSIGDKAFCVCNALTSIGDLPECTSIGDEAFEGCDALASVGNLPECTSIGYHTFFRCDALTSVGDLSQCTSIGNGAFYQCYVLTSVGNLSKCTSIGDKAFEGCSALTSIGDLPECTSIGKSAFYKCSSLTSVGNLSKCTSIGDEAFYECSALTSVGDLSQYTSIGEKAFYRCSSLASIGDLSKCTSIGYLAFYYCSVLTSVDLSQCTSIGNEAFEGCSSLTSVGNLSKCTSIGNEAFYNCSSLTSVGNLPECTSIGSYAFYNCSALTSVDLSQCTSIGSMAFYNCSALTSVGDLSQCISIGESAFCRCFSLASVGDLSKCTSIGGAAFYNCSALTSVGDLPQCISIGVNAFYGCYALTSVGDLPQCTSIGYGAFCNCSALTSIGDLSKCTSIGYLAFYYCSVLTSVDLSQCTSIGNEAFEGCSSLTSVGDLPQCTSIGYGAFYCCYALNKIVLSSETMATAGSNVTSECTSVLVPESLLVAYRTADNWKDMAYRILPIEVNTEYDVVVSASDNSSAVQTAIGEEKLANVIALKVKGSINGYDVMILRNKMLNLHSIDLSEANIVEDANHYCYYGSYYTKNNVFPEYLFYKHNNISSVQMPESITEIGQCAFNSCRNLHKIEIPENVVTIGEYAFANCVLSQSVIIPDNVVTIDESAFADCDLLQSVIIPDNVETIGRYAFGWCYNLQKVVIGKSVKTIGHEAFYDCSALSDLTLGNAVETIESDAFESCVNLKTLTIPSSVKYIGGYAFSGCPLEEVYATSVLPIEISQNAFSTWTTATLYVPKDDENDWNATYNAYYWNTQWSQFASLQSWTPKYEYFYLEDDYEMESGEIPGTDEKDPDADLGEESGLIVDEGAHQDMGEVNVDSDGESGGSIIAEGGSESSDEGNVTMDKLNIKIAVQPNKWYFFCFPFDIAKEAITCDANYVFRHYDGKSRAEHGNSGWKNVTESEGDYLKAGKGYIFQCDKSTDLVLTIDNPAFNGKNKKSPELAANASNNAQDANWNFVGNPFLSYFNLDDLQYNAPVTVWNGSTYEALRPGDDDYSFHPFQAFFIQKPEDVDDFEFYARGRETKKQSEKNQAKAKAMRAKKAPAADRKLINLIITDGENVDKTRVVFNGKKSDAYEMDCDAAKFMSTAKVPQIYTLDNKNVKYAINERPSGSVKLGYVATKAGTLTIAVARMEQTVSIKDNETGTITPLTDDYSFETEAGTFNERFVLLLGDPTGIKELASPESSPEEQNLYNVNGVKVGSNYEGVVIAKDKKYIKK